MMESKKCTPCRTGDVPLKGEKLVELQKQLYEGWSVVKEEHLEKTYREDSVSQDFSR